MFQLIFVLRLYNTIFSWIEKKRSSLWLFVDKTHHFSWFFTQPTSTLSRIKYERYIFIKKCVRSFIEVVIIVDYVSTYICIRVVVLRLYNTIAVIDYADNLVLLANTHAQPLRVSCLWHKTACWWGFSDAGALGNAEYPIIAIAPRSTLARNGRTW